MGFDPPDVAEYADLKVDDLPEWKARVKELRIAARADGISDTFKEWLREVNRLAQTVKHRRAIAEHGVGIDTGSDPDLARVLINQLTTGSVRPAMHGCDVMVYDGNGLFVRWSPADLTCKAMLLDGAPYFDDKGKPQILSMGTKRSKDVVSAIVSSLSGTVSSGGLGRGAEWFADAPSGIMFQNCFLTIQGDAVVSEPVSPTHRAIHRHSMRYDPDEGAPKFRTYMDEMLTPEQLPAMQELLGAALFGVGPMYQRAGFIRGRPGTGKSTLVKILKGIMPPKTVTSSEPGSWDNPQFVAQLHGMLLNGIEELRNTHFGDVNSIKAMVVGDEVTVKEVYKPVFAFRPIATHIIASNEWPRTANSDRAFWDRWLIFDLQGKRYRDTPEQVRDYDQVLLAEELPGIVAWVVEGMIRLAQNGRYTEVNDGAHEQWRSQSNNIAVYARDSLHFLADADKPLQTSKKAVYEDYRQWCMECGYQALGRNKFYTALQREDHIETCGRTQASFNVALKSDQRWSATG